MESLAISDYEDDSLDLQCARQDAESLADVFRARGETFYGAGKVHVTTVLDKQATRDGIEAAIQDVAANATPNDVFVLTISGHGVTLGQRYYFIPHEYQSGDRDWADYKVRRYLWDVETGRRLKKLKAHSSEVLGVAYDPTGKKIATAAHDGVVVWEVLSGKQLLRLARHDRQFRSYENSGTEKQDLKRVLPAGVLSVAFSPDGRYIATGLDGFSPEEDGIHASVVVWDAATGKVARAIGDPSWDVVSVAFSADGSQLMSAASNGTVVLWDVISGQNLCTLENEFSACSSVTSLDISTDGQSVIFGTQDNAAVVWSTRLPQTRTI
nr:hypothetical protein [uncultured bacterium]